MIVVRSGRILTLVGAVSLIGLLLTGVGTSQSGSEKLVFSTAGAPGSIELHAVAVDTGKTSPLTTQTPQGLDPAWSPDSRTMVFSAGEGSTSDFESTGVWVVSANGMRPRQLASQEADGSLYARYSPSGRRIAFTDGERLIVTDRGGAKGRVIARQGLIEALSWSPDGSRIAFSNFRGVFVVTVHGGRLVRVTRPQTRLEREGGYFWGPAWSPDGKRIAATKGWVDSDETTVIVVNARGGGQRSLGGGWSPFWVSSTTLAERRNQGIRFIHPDGRVIRTVNPAGGEFAFAWARSAQRLVFATQKGELLRLFSVDPNRGPSRALRRPLGPVRGDPVWSPDGRNMAVERAWRENASGNYVFAIELLRPGRKSIRILDPGVDSQPSPSPDGSQIVFARRANQRDGVVVMNADGGNARRVATGTQPFWSPDGGRISFERNAGIYSMNADGSSEVRLADGHSPSFSPDGSVVAFARGDAVYAVSATGGTARRLTADLCSDTASASQPSWSPDGTRIAFTLDCERVRIVVMRSDGSDLKLLGSGTSPSWSPRADKIVFRARDQETEEDFIYTMNTDGGARQPLVKNGLAPAWSPDGLRIAFQRQSPDGPGFDLYVINVDGSGEKRVGESAAEDPDGEPLRIAWLR